MPVAEAYVDDLPTPLPLGADVLPLAVFATSKKKKRLASTLGLRLLSQQRIEYYAEDRGVDLPAEQTLTAWLQWLRPYVFALRAYSHLVPVDQHIDLTVSKELLNRFTLAVVEVVDGVELRVDGRTVARQGPNTPVVLAHEADARQTIPVFLRRALADQNGQDAGRLLRYLAKPAAELAGDSGLAHTVELLLMTIGSPDDVLAEKFLRERCGVGARELGVVRDACGMVSAARELAAEEARVAARRTQWQSQVVVLARPLLGLMLCAGRLLQFRDLRARLDAHRDAEVPLDSVRRAFEPLGIPLDHEIWNLREMEEADKWLAQHPDLMKAISQAVSAEEDAAERRRAFEAGLQRARLHMLALARSRAPDARIQELIAVWDELADRADPERPGALSEVIRSFAAQLHLGTDVEETITVPPEGRMWSASHLVLLGITAADITEVSVEVQRYLDGSQDVQRRRENAYSAWVRCQRLHQKVKRVSVCLGLQGSLNTAMSSGTGGPAQILTMDGRGGTARYSREHRRNSLTGGLGEVFVLMQEVEIWRGLPSDSRCRLLDQVAAEYADIKAREAIERVRHGDPSSETWEESLASLLRIGDYSGARCDLLGVGPDEQLWYLEVKASARRRLDRFLLSAPEWEFLSDKSVRDRCAIVCVSGAAPGLTPVVELLERPACRDEKLFHPVASMYEVVLHRSSQ